MTIFLFLYNNKKNIINIPGKRLINTVDGIGAIPNVSNITGLLDKKVINILNLKLLALSYPSGLA